MSEETRQFLFKINSNSPYTIVELVKANAKPYIETIYIHNLVDSFALNLNLQFQPLLNSLSVVLEEDKNQLSGFDSAFELIVELQEDSVELIADLMENQPELYDIVDIILFGYEEDE